MTDQLGDPVLALAGRAVARSGGSAPRYLTVLADAAQDEPFACATALYAEMYRTAASSGQWTVMCLLRQAARAAHEARASWALAGRTDDRATEALLRDDACTESSRARGYLAVTTGSFEGAVPDELLADLAALDPDYRPEQRPPRAGHREPLSTATLVELNLASLRAARLVELEREAVHAHGASATTLDVVEQIGHGHLDRVTWTAALLDRAAARRSVRTLTDLTRRCLAALHRRTMEDVIDLGYHQRFGNYP